MSKLGDKIENALNEDRILLLGGQVLLGFAYRPYFESAFDQLSFEAKVAQTAVVVVMTLVIVWLMWPAPFHQLIEGGDNTQRIHRFTTLVLDWSLLPFAIGLALSCYVIASFMHISHANLIGFGMAVFSLAWWYILPFANHEKSKHAAVDVELKAEEAEQKNQGGTEIKEKIKKLLIECRMVLPGVQALLGFQLITFFMQGFSYLPQASKWIHCAGLLATAVATVLVITPAAYHRIAEAGEDTEDFHRTGTRLLLISMVFLGIGLFADFVVVMHKMGLALRSSLVIGIALLIGSYALWFVLPVLRRKDLSHSRSK